MSDLEDSESGDEMDAEASRMLCESIILTHSEASSLFYSATSGGFNELDGRDDEEGRLKDQADEEEIDSEEMDARLDALIGGSVAASPERNSSLETIQDPIKDEEGSLRGVGRRIKKRIFSLDRIEIFIPSLSAEESSNTAGFPYADIGNSNIAGRGDIDDSHYPHIPGAFSMYASRRNLSSPSPPTSPPATKKTDDGENCGYKVCSTKHPRLPSGKSRH